METTAVFLGLFLNSTIISSGPMITKFTEFMKELYVGFSILLIFFTSIFYKSMTASSY